MYIRLLYLIAMTILIIGCMIGSNSMSNSNQLWDLFYHPAHPCMIIMMYMS